MLEELKFKNFLSFRDEVTLSFEATKDDMGEGTHCVKMPDGKTLLRCALIYGPNASGKTNLLDAIAFLSDFLFTKPADMEESTGVIPFRFDVATPMQPTEFSLRFYVGDMRYWYELQLKSNCVLEEKLSYYKSVQPTMLFHRTMENGQSIVRLNSSAVKVSAAAQEELQLKCLKNMSFFAARKQVNMIMPLIDEASDWLRKGVMDLISPDTRLFNYATRQMEKNSDVKAHLLQFVHGADFNIVGFETKQEQHDMPEALMNFILQEKELSDEDRRRLSTRLSTDFQHTVKNERGVEVYSLPEQLQSRGTMRTLGLETAIYTAEHRDAVLPIDEIESSIHPELIEHILHQFFKTSGRSQLVITTHDDGLLSTMDDLFRKDMIWFTEKGEDGSSDLYSLVEFNGLNKITSFQRSYRSGRFGATPNIE